jgi:3-phenylpropionate/cinnamic acid dioxygenase small subunit
VTEQPSKTIPQSDPIYSEVCEFLHREAELLDRGEFEEWLGLLAEDITYRLPVSVNRSRKAKAETAQETEIFSDNKASLTLRVKRLGTDFAWAESPPSRTRHLVTNVRARQGAAPEEVEVASYFLVYRNRSSYSHSDLFSGERQDLLRRVDGEWRLARRVIHLDQAVIGSRNISIFL